MMWVLQGKCSLCSCESNLHMTQILRLSFADIDFPLFRMYSVPYVAIGNYVLSCHCIHKMMLFWKFTRVNTNIDCCLALFDLLNDFIIWEKRILWNLLLREWRKISCLVALNNIINFLKRRCSLSNNNKKLECFCKLNCNLFQPFQKHSTTSRARTEGAKK